MPDALICGLRSSRSIRLIRSIRSIGLSCWLAALCLAPASASEAPSAAANSEIESRMMALSAELRCLVCQNQTIADSHAGLAEDLRQQIREMLAKGMTERQILDYMTERYGDFVLYRPPFKASTALLWVGPALLMAGALGSLLVVLRRRQRMAASAFDPDTPDEDAPR
ncbi:MAG: cytochrome c-type biogenesis protein CcmH [Betaproteobacteria bacterium]|nr:cytochrome c-type biogenesis protein CcmH [Betaproteobacteria bacterium]